jgi:hypothetical protein
VSGQWLISMPVASRGAASHGTAADCEFPIYLDAIVANGPGIVKRPTARNSTSQPLVDMRVTFDEADFAGRAQGDARRGARPLWHHCFPGATPHRT